MSAEKGAKIFKTKDAGHKTGPNLSGIVGRVAGTMPGFNYSAANKSSGVTWTEDNLFDYLENPKKYIKGTIMVFAGIKKDTERRDLIAFLKDHK